MHSARLQPSPRGHRTRAPISLHSCRRQRISLTVTAPNSIGCLSINCWYLFIKLFASGGGFSTECLQKIVLHFSQRIASISVTFPVEVPSLFFKAANGGSGSGRRHLKASTYLAYLSAAITYKLSYAVAATRPALDHKF